MTGRPFSARGAAAAACLAVMLAACGTEEQAPVLEFDSDPASTSFGTVELVAGDDRLRALEARAGTAGWPSILAVFTEEAAGRPDQPPVLGDYALADGRLRFTPRFPPVPGQGYRIVVNATVEGATAFVLDTLVSVAAAARPPATYVVHVHPVTDPLPANLLRMYIEFSAPMSIGEAWDRMRLLDGNGAIVENALLVTRQELWDGDRRRLTILFDPGRIKTDVRANRELGLPLQPGESYTLVIDDAWADAEGLPLREGFRRTFRIGPADRVAPEPSRWTVAPPEAGTREPVTLVFDEPLDWGLLQHLLFVLDGDDGERTGSVSVDDDGMRWHFTPESRWERGDYVIRVRTDLEDLAGNNLRGLFDRVAGGDASDGKEWVEVRFAVK